MEIYSQHLRQTVPILAVPVNVFSKMKYRNVINGSEVWAQTVNGWVD